MHHLCPAQRRRTRQPASPPVPMQHRWAALLTVPHRRRAGLIALLVVELTLLLHARAGL